MKNVQTIVARPVCVKFNGAAKGDKWATIVCAKTGVTLHTGQVKYIRKVAVGRYNAMPSF
jgi:hypothetical protein